VEFLRKWLGLTIERPAQVAVRPSRVLELELPFVAAFARARQGLEHVLGAHVTNGSAGAGELEATFGLTFSERLACRLQSIDESHTRVTIESRRFAGGLSYSPTVLDRFERWMREGR